MTDMHPYEALKIALQEARDERDDWRESATRAAGESCGDERHCTCVGPLRKELRDAKAKLAALVALVEAVEKALHHDGLCHSHECVGMPWQCRCGVKTIKEAIAAAKVQP